MTYKEILNTLNPEVWRSLSDDEKIDYFQSIENCMAMESNRDNCKVNGKFLYTGEEGVVLGVYNPETVLKHYLLNMILRVEAHLFQCIQCYLICL